MGRLWISFILFAPLLVSPFTPYVLSRDYLNEAGLGCLAVQLVHRRLLMEGGRALVASIKGLNSRKVEHVK